MNKYNDILIEITEELKNTSIENPNGEGRKAREVEEVKNIDLIKGPKGLLDTTTEALQMLNLGNKKIYSREQLIMIVEILALLGIEYREQIQHDISLIADLDENCFRHAHT